MISVYSVLSTLMLLSELSSHFGAGAMPATKAEDNASEQDDLGLILGDEPMNAPAMVPSVYRRSHVLDNSAMDEDGSRKIVIVSDMRLKGSRGLNPAFTRSLPLLTDRSLSHSPAEHSLKIGRRNTDLDMLRCMIGRVYRPCWEIAP